MLLISSQRLIILCLFFEIYMIVLLLMHEQVTAVLQLGRIGERLDAILLSLRLYWTRHGNLAVVNFELLFLSTQGWTPHSLAPCLAL